MPWIGKTAKAPVCPDDGAALERPETESGIVERGPRLRVGEGKNLEAMVEQETVDRIGSDPSSDGIGALEHEWKTAAGDEPAGTGEAGYSCTDDDDVVLITHDLERTEARPPSMPITCRARASWVCRRRT